MEIKKLEDRLPLIGHPYSNSAETCFIADNDENFVARSVYNHDALYIVKACNNYREAIDLLVDAYRQLSDNYCPPHTETAEKIKTFLNEQEQK